MAKKKRYVEDGKIFFVRVTLVLHNGRIITGMDDTTIASVDSNYSVYRSKALDKWGSRIQTIEIDMISKHDPRAKKYMKENGISIPSSEPEYIEIPPPVPMPFIPITRDPRPGKYRSPNASQGPDITIGEAAELSRKREMGEKK